MGLGGIGIWQLLIVLVIVALIFGTKRLRNIGGDLGGAIKGFKKALDDDSEKKEADAAAEPEAAEARQADDADSKEK